MLCLLALLHSSLNPQENEAKSNAYKNHSAHNGIDVKAPPRELALQEAATTANCSSTDLACDRPTGEAFKPEKDARERTRWLLTGAALAETQALAETWRAEATAAMASYDCCGLWRLVL